MKDECKNKEYRVQECVKRHPRPCRYWKFFAMECKFGESCMYRHEENEELNILKILKKEIEEVKKVNDENMKADIKKLENKKLVLVKVIETLKRDKVDNARTSTEEELEKMKAEIKKLRAENYDLKKARKEMEEEKEKMKAENKKLREEGYNVNKVLTEIEEEREKEKEKEIKKIGKNTPKKTVTKKVDKKTPRKRILSPKATKALREVERMEETVDLLIEEREVKENELDNIKSVCRKLEETEKKKEEKVKDLYSVCHNMKKEIKTLRSVIAERSANSEAESSRRVAREALEEELKKKSK